MRPVEWEDISEYVAAGNLVKITISEDMDSIGIEIIYAGVSREEVTSTADIILECLNCCHLDMRRRDDHSPGSGVILEAYLHTESDLITALHNHQLDAVAGCLCLESTGQRVYHLEIIGEISLNVLCENVTIQSTPVRTE